MLNYSVQYWVGTEIWKNNGLGANSIVSNYTTTQEHMGDGKMSINPSTYHPYGVVGAGINWHFPRINPEQDWDTFCLYFTCISCCQLLVNSNSYKISLIINRKPIENIWYNDSIITSSIWKHFFTMKECFVFFFFTVSSQ